MSERATLVGAGAAHLGLIVALSLAWTHMERPVAPPPDAVAVDLTEIADTPRASAPPREATAPPTPPMPRAEPPPPPAPVAEPAPAPSVVKPAPPPPPKAVKPDPEPVDEPAPKPKPHKVKPQTPAKPQPDARDLSRSLSELLDKAPARPTPRPRADPNQLASLLDKELGHAPPRSAAKPGPAQTAQPANAELSPLAKATLVQAIAAQIEKCWNPPSGLPESTTVKLRLRFTSSGAVAAPPEVVQQTGAVDPAIRRVFDESAKRAVERCSPLRLPKDQYSTWRDIAFRFDPKDLP